jgi:hypothetical protein
VLHLTVAVGDLRLVFRCGYWRRFRSAAVVLVARTLYSYKLILTQVQQRNVR